MGFIIIICLLRMCSALFIQNEKADIIHRIPLTSSNQFSFPCVCSLAPPPFIYLIYDGIARFVSVLQPLSGVFLNETSHHVSSRSCTGGLDSAEGCGLQARRRDRQSPSPQRSRRGFVHRAHRISPSSPLAPLSLLRVNSVLFAVDFDDFSLRY